MGINKSTAKKLQYRRVFWPGNIKSTGTVNRYFRVLKKLSLYFLVSIELKIKSGGEFMLDVFEMTMY